MTNVDLFNPGFARGPMVTLQHPSGRDFSYNVFFVARNGAWYQQLRMKWIGNGWSVATRISGLSEGKELYRNVTPGYQLGPDSEVEWEDKPTPGGSTAIMVYNFLNSDVYLFKLLVYTSRNSGCINAPFRTVMRRCA
jgi:hypothetical protein